MIFPIVTGVHLVCNSLLRGRRWLFLRIQCHPTISLFSHCRRDKSTRLLATVATRISQINWTCIHTRHSGGPWRAVHVLCHKYTSKALSRSRGWVQATRDGLLKWGRQSEGSLRVPPVESRKSKKPVHGPLDPRISICRWSIPSLALCGSIEGQLQTDRQTRDSERGRGTVAYRRRLRRLVAVVTTLVSESYVNGHLLGNKIENTFLCRIDTTTATEAANGK